MKIRLGGMRMPRVPDAASAPVARRASYLKRRISGMTIVPIVATVAILDPVTAPNPPQASTDEIAMPPGTRPTHFLSPSYRSLASPA